MKNQEVDGKYEEDKDQPGQEVKQEIDDAVSTKEVASVYLC